MKQANKHGTLVAGALALEPTLQHKLLFETLALDFT